MSRGIFMMGMFIAAFSITSPALATVSYFNSLTGTTLDPNLSITTSSSDFRVTLPGGEALMTKNAGAANGSTYINSNFTFSGYYTVTVDVFGLQTGLAGKGDAGLGVEDGTTFSDIFGFNNRLNYSNNHIGASILSDTNVAPGEELLTISGYTSVPLGFNIFLLQESGVGGYSNSVSFENLSLTADQFSSSFVAPVPTPGSLPLLGTGLVGLAGLLWRRRRSVAA